MARKNAKVPGRVRARAKPKPKKSKTDRPGPKTPADEEAVVSRITMIRHTGRGGRGR